MTGKHVLRLVRSSRHASKGVESRVPRQEREQWGRRRCSRSGKRTHADVLNRVRGNREDGSRLSTAGVHVVHHVRWVVVGMREHEDRGLHGSHVLRLLRLLMHLQLRSVHLLLRSEGRADRLLRRRIGIGLGSRLTGHGSRSCGSSGRMHHLSSSRWTGRRGRRRGILTTGACLSKHVAPRRLDLALQGSGVRGGSRVHRSNRVTGVRGLVWRRRRRLVGLRVRVLLRRVRLVGSRIHRV